MITPMAPAVSRRTSALAGSAAGGNVIARIAAIVPKATAKLNLVTQLAARCVPDGQRPSIGGRSSCDGQATPDATAWAIRSPISLVE